MQSQLTSLKNPRWADEAQTMIDCEITTTQFGDEILPFTASMNDCESHGRGIFADISAGVYGEIAAYIPPPAPPVTLKNTATPESNAIPQSIL